MELHAFAADPVTVGTLAGALALILFAAAWHKLAEREAFALALGAYRLLPQPAVPAAAIALPIVEIALGVGILLPATREPALGGVALLMFAYALAIAANLARGRRDIDCGCGGDSQPLSWALVLRNAVLAAAALIAGRPALERSLDWIDALSLVLGVLCFYALYLMADELLRQAGRFARGEEQS
jgi:hypothetical protein